MHTGKQKQMNASYQASLVNRHIRRFTGNSYAKSMLIGKVSCLVYDRKLIIIHWPRAKFCRVLTDLFTSEAEGRASFRWIWEFSQVERPTDRPTDRPWRFSASYIFWTKLPIDKWLSASESHIQ